MFYQHKERLININSTIEWF